MFEIKSLDFCFAILCLDINPISVRNTIKSLAISHPGYPVITAVPSSTPAPTLKQLKELAPLYKGKTTVTSLINVAMKNSPAKWVVFIVAGTWIKFKICNKISRFIDSDSDIIFPITANVYDFPHCTLNGLCISKDNFHKIGPMEEEGDLINLKERWAILATAINNCAFKAVAGATIG